MRREQLHAGICLVQQHLHLIRGRARAQRNRDLDGPRLPVGCKCYRLAQPNVLAVVLPLPHEHPPLPAPACRIVLASGLPSIILHQRMATRTLARVARVIECCGWQEAGMGPAREESAMDFSRFDARNYPTVSVQDGYGEWAATYEDIVLDAMDLRLLARIRTVDWAQVHKVADLACECARGGAGPWRPA